MKKTIIRVTALILAIGLCFGIIPVSAMNADVIDAEIIQAISIEENTSQEENSNEGFSDEGLSNEDPVDEEAVNGDNYWEESPMDNSVADASSDELLSEKDVTEPEEAAYENDQDENREEFSSDPEHTDESERADSSEFTDNFEHTNQAESTDNPELTEEPGPTEVIEESQKLQDVEIQEDAPEADLESDTKSGPETGEAPEDSEITGEGEKEETAQEVILFASNVDFEHSIAVSLNEVNSVTITNAWDMLYYSFTPETSGAYCFSSTGQGNAIAYLYYNANGYVSKSDVKNTTPANFTINYYMEQGHTYYLEVSSYNNNTTFSFSVTPSPTTGQSGSIYWNFDSDTGTFTVTGSGAMPDFTGRYANEWYHFAPMVKKVVIGTGITSIGDYSFSYCQNLEDLSLPSTVTRIGKYAFQECRNLKVLTIPDSVESIEDYAFSYCSGIEELTIPSSVSSIGPGAFYYCSGIEELTIPPTVASIGSDAFSYLFDLTTLTLYNGVTYAEDGVFNLLWSLKDVYFYGSEEEYYNIFSENDISELQAASIHFLYSAGECGSGLSWYLSTDGVLTISGTGTMISWTSESQTPWYSYRDQIKIVRIEYGVTSIGAYAFSDFTALQELILYYSTTEIGENAFDKCSGLHTVYYMGYEEYWDEIVIGASNSPLSSADRQYMVDCGFDSNFRWFLDQNGLLRITGAGNLERKGYLYHFPWLDYQLYIYDVVVSEGITGIGENAFYNCYNMRSISLPSTLTKIGNSAFYYCPSAKRITIPAGVTQIGDSAFYQCKELFFCANAPEGNWLSALQNAVIYYPGTAQGWEEMIAVSDPSNTWIPWYHAADLGQLTIQGEPSMLVGQQQKLFVSEQYILDLNWSSSNSSAVFVDSDGTVAAFGPGSAVITLSDGNDLVLSTFEITVSPIESPAVSNSSISGTGSTNTSQENYGVWSQTVNSYLYENGDGSFTRVEYLAKGSVLLETWDAQGIITASREIPGELPLFGGFFQGGEFYFLIFGQNNPDESDSAEIMRVVKYSKNWERLSSASVYGANTSYPFDAGSLRCAEADGKLYVHTCHEMYMSSDGYRHQANMTFVITQADMAVVDSYYDVMNISYGYVSHSFNQFIRADGSYIYRVDHSDAHPRGIALTKVSTDARITEVEYTVALSIPGSLGVNSTGVSIGGMEVGANRVLIAGNSVDLENYNTNGIRNIFLASVRKDLEEKQIIWITDYPNDSTVTACTPQLVKLNDYLYLLMWEEYDSASDSYTVRMCRVNENGQLVSNIVSGNMRLSDCQPILTSDGLVAWYTTTGITNFYQINPFDLDSVYVEGNGVIDSGYSSISGSNIWWYLTEDGVLTVGGSGSVEYSYTCGDQYYEQIRKVVILEGIASLDYCFQWMPVLESVWLPGSLVSVKENAFSYCPVLTDLYFDGTLAAWNEVSLEARAKATFGNVHRHFKSTSGYQVALSSSSLTLPTQSGSVLFATTQTPDLQQSELTWSSSNPAVASVDSHGVVTALTYGTTIITASLKDYPDQKAQCTVQTRYYDVNGSNVSGADDYQYWWSAVYWAADRAITKGYGNVYFGPDRNCTRRELAIFLWRLKGCPDSSSTQVPFQDVVKKYNRTTDTYKAIAWCYSSGIIKGFEDGTFRPDDNVTRKDTMIMLYRFAGKPSYSEVRGAMKFTDVVGVYNKNSDTYNAINWAYQTRITNGYGSYFGTWYSILRKDIVTFLYRYSN